MVSIRAVVFDLGGTLLDWPDWDEGSPRRWAMSHEHLLARLGPRDVPSREEYVQAMREAELAHWRLVEHELSSAPPSEVVREGFRRLGRQPVAAEIETALDGYARAVVGWAIPFPDSAATLRTLKVRGYRLGLLSNTWWAAEWHDADLALHGLADLLDAVVYTSDLPRSKPHPLVFREVAERLSVDVTSCVMVGDRMVDDVAGALNAGMRGVWKEHDRPFPRPPDVVPSATISQLSELPPLLQRWGGP